MKRQCERKCCNTTPLTAIKDIDQEIMQHMSIERLEALCLSHRYAYDICQDSYFWIKKMKAEGLIMPTHLPNCIHWLKAYKILNFIHHIPQSITFNTCQTCNQLVNVLKNFDPHVKMEYGESIIRFATPSDTIQQHHFMDWVRDPDYLDYQVSFHMVVKTCWYKNTLNVVTISVSQQDFVNVMFYLLYHGFIII